MQACRKCLHAFVVLELVFVFFILAILAALLFPLFARSMEQARSIPCLSHISQLGMALRIYVNDNDEAFPTMHREAANRIGDAYGEGYGGHWTVQNAARRAYFQSDSIGAQLLPYTDDWTVWLCPSDGGADLNWPIGRRWTSFHYRHYLSVGYAEGYAAFPGMRGKVWREASFEHPTQTYVFSELWPWHDERTEEAIWLKETSQPAWSRDSRLYLTFMDGHTRAARADRCLLRASWWPEQGYDYHWPRLDGLRDCGQDREVAQ